ncbi:citrate lyase holo-[acyl-carrier protein] synthase [Clostridium sp. E02]|uniref:citrate lyase holo-[acyl-carrier protein] synthase n=1 Tax=Clostridium sp. E02 TaxID=2487134 RepID=UPI000F51D103|nr:citrate lyase holo-[acyl-carrier protein] synthase [Clostridium sp. E02]
MVLTNNVTVEDILEFRDKKVRIQEELHLKYKGCTIVALAMNIPGPQKTSPDIYLAFTEGTTALETLLSKETLLLKERVTVTDKGGYLKLYAVDCKDPVLVKGLTVHLEETHPLGRLYDIDVYGEDGKGISRLMVGGRRRTCLICDKDAKICGRSRNHSVSELSSRIGTIINSWKNLFHS